MTKSTLPRGPPKSKVPQNLPPLKFSDITSLVDGPDLSGMKKLWEDNACCEARLKLLEKLRDKNLGFNEIEKFSLGLKYSLKSSKLQEMGSKPIQKVVKTAMDLKMKDEMFHEKELKRR